MKKEKLLFLVLILSTSAFVSKTNGSKIDSINSIINNENKPEQQFEKAWEILKSLERTDSAHIWPITNIIDRIGNEINRKEYQALALLEQGKILSFSGDINGALNKFYTAESLFDEVKSDPIESKLYNKSGLGALLSTMGQTLSIKGDVANSMKYSEAGIKVYQESGDSLFMAYSLITLGGQYGNIGQYETALNKYLAASKILNEINHPQKVLVNNFIAELYTTQGQYQAAQPYATKGLADAKSLGDPYILYFALKCHGINNMKLANYEVSMNNFTEAAALCNKMGLTDEEAIFYLFQSEIMLEQNQRELASTYLNQAKKLVDQSQVNYPKVNYLETLASHAEKSKNYSLAINNLQQALNIEEQNGDANNLVKLYKRIANLNNKAGNHATAFQFMEKYNLLNDSLLNEKVQINQRAQQVIYETEVKENKIIKLENEDLLNKASISRQRGIMGMGLLGLLSIGIISFFLYRSNQNKKQVNELLSEKNKIIQTKNEQNELLLKEIHHRVKNNLQTISSLLYLQSSNIDEGEVKAAVKSSQNRVETMALIHQKLYQKDNFAAIEMKDYLTNLTTGLGEAFGVDNDKIKFEIEMKPIEIDIDTAVPIGLIANELITNSLKYAFPNGNQGIIKVKLKEENDQYHFSIRDNGIGKTETIRKGAFGSKLVKMLVKQIKGELSEGNENGHWTNILITT